MFARKITKLHKSLNVKSLASPKPVNVLYIDDEEVDRMLMQRHVKRHAGKYVNLDCVECPADAVSALALKKYDYIVTDNRIPPISNYRETLDIIDLSAFHGRIILVSIESKSDYFKAEGDERLHCVIDKVDLLQAIKDGLFAPLHQTEADLDIDMSRRSLLSFASRQPSFA